MSYFQAIQVRLVLDVSTICIRNRIRDETKNRKKQQQSWEGRPIVEPLDAPARSRSRQQPSYAAIPKIKQNKQQRHAESESLPHVSKHVMPHLMAHHGYGSPAWSPFTADRRIPTPRFASTLQFPSHTHSWSASCHSPSSRTCGPVGLSSPDRWTTRSIWATSAESFS